MRNLYPLLFLLLSFRIFSQANFQGKAMYQSKTTVDMNSWGRKMSKERKKQIMQRMKNMLEKTYALHFTRYESTYKEEAKLDAPGSRGGFRFGGFGGSGTLYKNIKESKIINSKESFGKQFLITESSKKPKWELGSETKQIGNYTCLKATLVKEVDASDWRNMRRRNKESKEKKKDTTNTKKILDEIEIPKTIVVTAWYTPQIPVSNGPGNYWGLPGLILEINEGRTTVLCSEIVMNPSEKIEIKAPVKGKKITKKEYTKIMVKKMEEMREMFRNRRGNRGDRRRRQ